jgi:4-amino-4-deoxy-L-arabinose transferase-like glycosyltransferase
VTAVLVLGPLMAWQYLECRGPAVSLGRWFGYVGVALLVAGPWYVAVALHDPDATGTFFWLHNIVRYLAPFDHEKPSWFYLPGLLIGMLPWTFLLIPLVPYLARRSPNWARRRPAGLGFFLLAFLWCLLFFSLSGCKRAAYILPALPALAVVLGTFLARAIHWNARTQTAFALTAGMTAVALILASYVMLPDYHSRFALRAVVRPHVGLARHIAVVCYPRRWDSVSFYLGREVACFGAEELGQLIGRMHDAETLLFVKSGNVFDDMLRALPQDLEFVPRGRQGANVRVGLVQRICPKS